jgi:hypothetical protein
MKPTGNTIGRWGGGRTITRAFPTWASKPQDKRDNRMKERSRKTGSKD